MKGNPGSFAFDQYFEGQMRCLAAFVSYRVFQLRVTASERTYQRIHMADEIGSGHRNRKLSLYVLVYMREAISGCIDAIGWMHVGDR